MLIEALKYDKRANDWTTVYIYSEKITFIEGTSEDYDDRIQITNIGLVSGITIPIIEIDSNFIFRLRYNIESADDARREIYGIESECDK